MPRDPSARENRLKAKARRDHAIRRLDLREPTVPREPALGATSQAVKVMDPASAAAIAVYLKGRST